MDFNINSYPELKEAIERDNLVLFVGAGCSLKLKNKEGSEIGNWENFVEKILEHLQNKGYDVAHLQKALKTKSALEILQFLESFSTEIGKNIIYEFTDRFLELDDISSINDFSFHNLLAAVSSKVITTNYDRAFEIASPEVFKNCVIKGDESKIERIKKDNNFLLKLHGCYTRERTMVLFKSDYEELYNNDRNLDSVHLLTCLTNLFYNKTILFIGYGMGDEEINLILKNIQKVTHQYSHKHYIITNEKLNEELKAFLIHIPIKDFEELPEVINNLIAAKEKYHKEKNKKLSELAILTTKYDQLITDLFNEGIEYHEAKEFEKEIIKYEQISKFEKYLIVLNNWASALCDLAELRGDEVLYLKSIKKFKEANELNENHYLIFNNWGLAIVGYATLLKNRNFDSLAVIGLFEESIRKFEFANEIQKNDPLIINNYGVALGNLAELKRSDSLFEKCLEVFRESLFLDKNNLNTNQNFANALYVYSNFNSHKREDLLNESISILRFSYTLNNENAKTLDILGMVLYQLGKMKNNSEKEILFIESEIFLLKSMSKGYSIYNLACLYSVWNKKEKALENLEIVVKNNGISIFHVDKDEDWENFRNDEDFKTLLNKYRE